MNRSYRNTSQYPIPLFKPETLPGNYDIYPTLDIGTGKIHKSIKKLVSQLPLDKLVVIDGYSGTNFANLIETISVSYADIADSIPDFIDISKCLKEESEIEEMIKEFMGGNDPLFGKRTTLSLQDFFDDSKLESFRHDIEGQNCIVYGTGASLISQSAFIVYVDLPKNEIQFRSRAGLDTNIGSSYRNPKHDYKRNYFVDWIVQNKYKKSILPVLSILVDGQRFENITFISGDNLRRSLKQLSTSVFRVRPWFEPGVWGGEWIRNNINGLNKDVQNYAWSFELITPENGLILSSSRLILEFSFDLLMFQEGENVLGDAFERFGYEFPIRFDFLDTFNGGNLSIQCHPRPEYTLREFGETFTQEETYYILDTKDNAVVYLGFQENINPKEFRNELENSYLNSESVDITKHIQSHPASKHDLFLIPYGTIHGSGNNNLVLEISSTPYIFTFKMYDWLRKDLDGNLRQINIDRGMANLNFNRKGNKVIKELISKPVIIDRGDDWILEHLPTHETHFYDVHRYKFKSSITIKTNNKCHVISLVEGTSILLETISGHKTRFNYVETFVIPAATREYRIINESGSESILIIAFVKNNKNK